MVRFYTTFDALPFASIQAEVTERVQDGRGQSFLLLVSTRTQARELERQLIQKAYPKAITSPEIYTAVELASALTRVAFPELRPIDDAEMAILLESTVSELLAEHKLTYFEEQKTSITSKLPLRIGTFELIFSTIRKLKESGVSPELLERSVNNTGVEDPIAAQRTKDIHSIYQRYTEHVRSRFIDNHGHLLLLNERYGRSPDLFLRDVAILLPKVRDIFVEGYSALESPVRQFLSAILKCGAHSLTVAIPEIVVNPGNSENFSPLVAMAEQLQNLGLRPIEAREALAAPRFATIRSSRSIRAEVENVARTVKRLSEEAGAEFDPSTIGVASFHGGEYTSLCREIFRKYKIDAVVIDRLKIEESSLFHSVILLIDMLWAGLTSTSIISLLRNPYFTFETEGSPLDPENLLLVMSEERIAAKFVLWRRLLSGRINAAAKQYEEDKERNKDDISVYHLERRIERMRRALRDVLAIERLQSGFLDPMKPTEFVERLAVLFSELRLEANILHYGDQLYQTGEFVKELHAFTAIKEMLRDLAALLELGGSAEQKNTAEYYAEKVRASALWTRYNPPAALGGVHISTFRQIEGMKFEHLFLLGLGDGIFPSSYEPPIFLPKNYHESEEDTLQAERLLFYSLLGSAKERVHLSYCAGEFDTLSGSSLLAELNEEVLEASEEEELSLYDPSEIYRCADLLRSSEIMLNPDIVGEPGTTVREVLHSRLPLAIEADKARRSDAKSPYTGYVRLTRHSDAARELLEGYATHVFSVSQLERFASCRQRYFLGDLLKLAVAETVGEGLDARDKGSVLHKVLERMHTDLLDRAENLRTISEARVEEVIQSALDQAETALDKIDTGDPFFRLDREIVLRSDEASLIRKYVASERDAMSYDLKPWRLEVEFGGKPGSNRAIADEEIKQPYEIKGIRLRGRIDRIDTSEDHTQFAVVDYKTTSGSNKEEIARGLSLQLPLYIRVAYDLLVQEGIVNPIGIAGLYYELKKGKIAKTLITRPTYKEKFGKRAGPFDTPQQMEEFIELVIGRTKSYVEELVKGEFPVVESDQYGKACKYCGYGAVCRVKEADDRDLLRAPPELMVV